MHSINTGRARRASLFGGALFHAGLVGATAAQPLAVIDRAIDEAPRQLSSVAIADLNGDGRPDIASGRIGSLGAGAEGGVSIHLSNGGMPPTFGASIVESDLFSYVRRIAVGDLDGDGHMDLVAGNDPPPGGAIVEWFQNDGASVPDFGTGLIVGQPNALGGFATTRDLALGDMDGDNDLDILVASYAYGYGGSIYWAENSGNGGFAATHVLADNAPFPEGADLCDIDGDGDLDAVVGWFNNSSGSGEVLWFENDGAADPQFTERLMGAVGSGDIDVVCGDVDGDGDMDVFFGRSSLAASSAGWLENDGGSPPVFTIQTIPTDGLNTVDLVAADLDGDGDLDLAGQTNSGGSPLRLLRWWENDGAEDPSFTPATVFDYGTGPFMRALAAGDLDGDGDADFVSAHVNPSRLAWFENLTDPLPVITDQPSSLFVTAPDTAVFTVVATGATFYQWKLNGADLSDDGTYSGADTPTLAVNASLTTIGVFECVVGNAAGLVASDGAVLSVSPSASTCPGDLNGDGTTDVFDFAEFAFDFGCVTP